MLGIYDSGIGGLTILKQIQKTLPKLNFNYLFDFEFMPLGQKNVYEIQERSKQAANFLFNKNSSIVILACNTACVNSIRYLQNVWLKENKFKNKQVLSITKPFLEKINQELYNYKNKKGLMLCTKATFNSGFYQYELIKNGFNKVNSIYFDNLAKLIETNDKKAITNLLDRKFRNIDTNSISFLLLACTHYPLIKTKIASYFNKRARIIEPALETAVKLKQYLINHTEYSVAKGKNTFYTTGNPKNLEYKLKQFYFLDKKYKIKNVKL